MKLQFVETVKQKVELEVPDYYSWDDSFRGRLVDVISAQHARRDSGGKNPLRELLFRDDHGTVKGAVASLEENYALADQIIALIESEKGAS